MLYRSRMNPSLGRNFEAMDPLEWLARLSPPEKPPPQIHDVLRVPVDDEGREIELQPA